MNNIKKYNWKNVLEYLGIEKTQYKKIRRRGYLECTKGFDICEKNPKIIEFLRFNDEEFLYVLEVFEEYNIEILQFQMPKSAMGLASSATIELKDIK